MARKRQRKARAGLNENSRYGQDMVLTNHNYSFIFLHIYRTGGRSFELAVPGCVGLMPSLPRMVEVRRFMIAKGKGEAFKTAFKCTQTRNPFDWQAAVLRFMKRFKTHPFHKTVQKFSILDYMIWLRDVGFVKHPNTFYTQYDFASDETGLLVDYCGKLETFRESVEYVCKKLRVKPPNRDDAMPHIHEYPKARHYRELYDPQARRIAEDLFHMDLQTFNYEF